MKKKRKEKEKLDEDSVVYQEIRPERGVTTRKRFQVLEELKS